MRTFAIVPLLLALALSACAPASPPEGGAGASPSPTPTATPTPSPAPTAVIDVPISSSAVAPAQAVPPTRVQIGVVGVDIPVIPVGIEDSGFMELPEDPAVAGWYSYGPAVATGAGNTVISAHIDSPDYPIGPFASLRDVPGGSEVVVDSADGSVARFVVESVTYYAKTELPVDDIFSRTGPAALVLITCGGEFDSSIGRYKDNVVLIARPAA